jgi:hypothetical protein
MKLKPLITLVVLSMLGLMTSAVSFAHSKAQLDASAANALTHFYALNPANRKLVDRAAPAVRAMNCTGLAYASAPRD